MSRTPLFVNLVTLKKSDRIENDEISPGLYYTSYMNWFSVK